MAAKNLGINYEVINISPVLKALEVYRFITNYITGRKFAGKIIRTSMIFRTLKPAPVQSY
jgi:hypothetical protein